MTCVDTFTAETQYPHIPKSTLPDAVPLAMITFSCTYAVKLNNTIVFMTGTESETSNKSKKAMNKNRGGSHGTKNMVTSKMLGEGEPLESQYM